MKTILWATLSANGNYATANAEHPPKPETLKDFAEQAGKAGNFIAGRKTFEVFSSDNSRKTENADEAMKTVEPVVLSDNDGEISGVQTFSSPREALEYLENKGFEVALLAGGETLHNSFLAENLVDEIIFNFAPVLESAGMNLILPQGEYGEVKLLSAKELGGGVVQMHYKIEK